MKVQYGCLTLAPCALTTFTYRTVGPERRNAQSVAQDWKELWRRWKRDGHPRIEWLRVIELTKQKQPHLHVVMGPIPGRIRCYGKDLDTAFFIRAGTRGCLCLSHRLSRLWSDITGDSWIVHTMPVAGARGIGKYLGKYLGKSQLVRQELEQLGFKRRWSSTRGYSGGDRLRLRQTQEGGWKEVQWTPPNRMALAIPDGPETLKERVGTDLAVALASRGNQHRIVTQLRRLLDAENVRQT